MATDGEDDVAGVFAFLAAIAPSLIELGKTLFSAFDGDAEAAIRNIEDRREEISSKRAERDRQLEEKHRED